MTIYMLLFRRREQMWSYSSYSDKIKELKNDKKNLKIKIKK